MLKRLIKLPLMAATALVFSGAMAAAVTLGFSTGGGNGKAFDLGPGGIFDASFALSSNNNGHKNKDTVVYGVTGAAEALAVSGVWLYGTNDKRNASKDPLGYFVGAVYTALSYAKRSAFYDHGMEAGHFAFLVPANTVFGWVLGSTDGKKGRAHAVIFAKFQPAPVPLPASGLLLLGAVAGLTALRRKAAV